MRGEKMRAYIFDICGTLADIRHRLQYIERDPKDWDTFFDECVSDAPIVHMCELARRLGRHDKIVFVTGRPARIRSQTQAWLALNANYCHPLYMRKDGDHRPDYEVKEEILSQMRADGYEPIMAFDDRTQVVQMWRKCGIPCAQVADGDY